MTHPRHDGQRTTLANFGKLFSRTICAVHDPFDIRSELGTVGGQAFSRFRGVHTTLFRVFIAVRHEWLAQCDLVNPVYHPSAV